MFVDFSHYSDITNGTTAEFLPNLDALEDKEIAPSLENFSFSKDSLPFDESLYRDDTRVEEGDEDENGAAFDAFGAGDAPMDIDGGGPPETQDFFQGDQAIDDDFYSGDGGAGGDDYGRAESGSVGAEGEQGQTTRSGPFVPFDPRKAPTERDLVVAMTDADGQSGLLGYFDQNVMKNWAGPEHWKLRRVIRKRETTTLVLWTWLTVYVAEPVEGAGPKSRREKKEAFKIDFLTPAEKDIKTLTKELFAPVTRGHGITLPHYGMLKAASKKGSRNKRAKEEKRDEHTLPDDMHFSSRQLVTLFLKPKFSVSP